METLKIIFIAPNMDAKSTRIPIQLILHKSLMQMQYGQQWKQLLSQFYATESKSKQLVASYISVINGVYLLLTPYCESTTSPSNSPDWCQKNAWYQSTGPKNVKLRMPYGLLPLILLLPPKLLLPPTLLLLPIPGLQTLVHLPDRPLEMPDLLRCRLVRPSVIPVLALSVLAPELIFHVSTPLSPVLDSRPLGAMQYRLPSHSVCQPLELLVSLWLRLVPPISVI